jgi:hypothetical protein
MVFCARIADHPKPWFRYVPLDAGLRPVVAEDGSPIVVDDTLTCLSWADPTAAGGPSVSSVFESGVAAAASYEAAFDAWAVARRHIQEAWMFNADPANLSRPVPRVMRDAAALVRSAGAFLGDRQDDLVGRLEAPYASRILREIRSVLTSTGLSDRAQVAALLEAADRLGLVVQPAPQPRDRCPSSRRLPLMASKPSRAAATDGPDRPPAVGVRVALRRRCSASRTAWLV